MDGVLVTLTFDNKPLKTDTIKNGKFEMLSKLPNNRLFILSFLESEGKKTSSGMLVRNWPHINLFTDDKESEIFLVADSIEGLLRFDTYKVQSKGKSQIEYNKYLLLLKADRDKNKLKHAYLSKKQDEALFAKNDILYTLYSDSLRFQEQISKITHNTVTRNFILTNPNSYVSMYLLSRRTDLKNNLAFYQLLYDKADRKYKKSWYGLYFSKRVEQLENLKEKYVKKLNINAFDVAGSSFDYSKYHESKLIVIDLWATWCIPCMEDIPAALKLSNELKKISVSYIFLSYDFNDKYWAQRSEKMGLINSYYLSEDSRRLLNEELGVLSIPRYMILSNKGEILVIDAPSPSSPELSKLIQNLL